MTAPVPVQFASEDEEEIVLKLATVVNGIALGILILLIIAQILGKSLIKRVWSLFCSLQIILLTESLKSAQPPNLTVFRTEIQNVLELNAIPREDIKAWSVSRGVKLVQLTSGLWEQNGFVILFAIIAIATILVGLLSLCFKNGTGCMGKVTRFLMEKLFYSKIIKSFLSAFLSLSIGAIAALQTGISNFSSKKNESQENEEEETDSEIWSTI